LVWIPWLKRSHLVVGWRPLRITPPSPSRRGGGEMNLLSSLAGDGRERGCLRSNRCPYILNY